MRLSNASALLTRREVVIVVESRVPYGFLTSICIRSLNHPPHGEVIMLAQLCDLLLEKRVENKNKRNPYRTQALTHCLAHCMLVWWTASVVFQPSLHIECITIETHLYETMRDVSVSFVCELHQNACACMS